MKIKFNSDDDLPLNKTLELRNMVIVVTSVVVFFRGQQTLSASFFRLMFV